MAIIPCPECNAEVSDKAKTCPTCGYPFSSTTPAISAFTQQDPIVTPTKLPRRTVKLVAFIGIGLLVVLIAVGSMILIPSFVRMQKFNSDLQTKWAARVNEGASVSVKGVYADTIAFTQSKEGFAKFIGMATSDSETLDFQNMVQSVYKLYCASYLLERLEKLSPLLSETKYSNDPLLKGVLTSTAICTIKDGVATFQYHLDKYGNEVFTINGNRVP